MIVVLTRGFLPVRIWSYCQNAYKSSSCSVTPEQLRLPTALFYLIEEGRGDWLVNLAAVHQLTHRTGAPRDDMAQRIEPPQLRADGWHQCN